MNIQDLAKTIDPKNTILFLGAGTSIPSGAPSGYDLMRFLESELHGGKHVSNDYTECCQALEELYGRQALIDAIKKRLTPLTPTGGLKALPSVDWNAIYTTNFDMLIERAYQGHNKHLRVYRSNFDFNGMSSVSHCSLYKMHGCISMDRSTGSQASIVTTQDDYEEFSKYRECLWSKISSALSENHLVILGYSMGDAHVKELLSRAAKLNREIGAVGRTTIIVFEQDDVKKMLWEKKGLRVVYGGIDEFVQAVIAAQTDRTDLPEEAAPDLLLPQELVAHVIDVRHSAGLQPRPARLFQGSPATYSDIKSDCTFQRDVEAAMVERFKSGKLVQSIIGVSGVGKTTLARRILWLMSQLGYLAFEQRPEIVFKPELWKRAEVGLRNSGRKAILLLDDIESNLGHINELLKGLASLELSSLQILVTAERGQWAYRKKSPYFFSHGYVEDLRRLSESEMSAMCSLVLSNQAINKMTSKSFLKLTRIKQLSMLKSKCAADMFVCLKYIFENESLDHILLREFKALENRHQEVYRHVAALEAAGLRVHRQLIVRLLNIETERLRSLLDGLEDIIEEGEYRKEIGVYLWSTRHKVIAETITSYKFSDQAEMYELLTQVCQNINASVDVEFKSVADLCTSRGGIEALEDPGKQIELYNLLISAAPRSRVPRHRLIRKYLELDRYAEAEQAIKEAETEVGSDGPIARYRILLQLQRSTSPGLMKKDRIAIVDRAFSAAKKAIKKHSDDMHMFVLLMEVAKQHSELTKDWAAAAEALDTSQKAAEIILDPFLREKISELERFGRAFRDTSKLGKV